MLSIFRDPDQYSTVQRKMLINCPLLIYHYNSNVNSVELDQLITNYKLDRRNKK